MTELQKSSKQPHNSYTPNHIPRNERVKHVIFSVFLLIYGGYGVLANDLYIPGKRSRGIHLHDAPAWVMYGAFLCACFVMLSVVADHYDTRDNENDYAFFANTFKYLGWGCVALSLILSFTY